MPETSGSYHVGAKIQIFPIHYEPRLPASHQYIYLSGRAYMLRLSAEKVGLVHPQSRDMLAFATIAHLGPVFHRHGNHYTDMSFFLVFSPCHGKEQSLSATMVRSRLRPKQYPRGCGELVSVEGRLLLPPALL